MNSMFVRCGSLPSLDLSNFNTEKVTDMYNMFSGCGKVTDGVPAVGYAKDEDTAEKFNDNNKTCIYPSCLVFRVK